MGSGRPVRTYGNIAIRCHTMPYNGIQIVNIVHPGRSFSCKEMVDDLSALGLRHVGDTTEATHNGLLNELLLSALIVTVFIFLRRFSMQWGGIEVSCSKALKEPKGKNQTVFGRFPCVPGPRVWYLKKNKRNKKYWVVLVQKIKNDK